jgi:aminopeptidase-like protein
MSLMFPSTPNFIAVVGNLSSRGLVNQVADSIRKSSSVPAETLSTAGFVPGVDFSDHLSFWKMDYPAVMITDTAFYRNPNYHTAADKIDTLDFGRLASLLDGLLRMAKDLSRE